MATLMIMEWPGVSSAQYQRAVSALGLDTSPPKGLLLHVASFAGETLRVVDLWESKADFELFQRDRLVAAAQKSGIAGQPTVKFSEIEKVFSPALEQLRDRAAPEARV